MLVNYNSCILAKDLGLAQVTKQTREGVSVGLGLSGLEQRKKIIEAALLYHIGNCVIFDQLDAISHTLSLEGQQLLQTVG